LEATEFTAVPCMHQMGRNTKLTCVLRRSPPEMKFEQNSMEAAVIDMDRKVIRIDMPPEHAGVMAALRRAFENAAREPTDHDFADLLRRLN
jgi:hypothetical protein